MDKTSDLEILERLSTTCEWVGAVIMRQRRRPRYSTLDMTSSEFWLLTTLFLIGQYWPQLETDVLMQTLTGRRFLKDNQTRGQDNGPISFEGGPILWWECGEAWPGGDQGWVLRVRWANTNMKCEPRQLMWPPWSIQGSVPDRRK